jgi:hypothetical protein
VKADKATYWRHRAEEAERKLEDIHVVALWLPIEYVDALAAALHMAYNGTAGEKTGGLTAFESKEPKRDPHAAKVLTDERTAILRRADGLMTALEHRRKGAA